MSDATAAAKTTAKAGKNVLKAVETAVADIPVSVGTTSTNVVVKFSKRYSVAVIGTATVTIAAVKLLELRKARKEMAEEFKQFPDS